MRERERQLEQLWTVCSTLRAQIQTERDDHRTHIKTAWDHISFLMDHWAGPGLRDSNMRGYSGLTDERDQETERLRKLSLANKCVQKWQVETRRTQERLFSFIAVQSLAWREKAKRTVLLRQQELQDESAVLLDIEQRKASGFPLSLSEENYLRMTPEERRRPDPTFDCPVCFNTVGLSAIVILDCRHRFCQGCLQEHVNVGLGDNRALVLDCPEDGCRRKLTVGEIKSILGPTMSAQFARYNELLLQNHLARDKVTSV